MCAFRASPYSTSTWFINTEMQNKFMLMAQRQPTSAPESTAPLEGIQSISFAWFPNSGNMISLPQKRSSANVSVLVQPNGRVIPALLSPWSPLGGNEHLWLTYCWFSVVGCPTEHLFLCENTRVLLKLINSAVGGDYLHTAHSLYISNTDQVIVSERSYSTSNQLPLWRKQDLSAFFLADSHQCPKAHPFYFGGTY